MSFHRCTAALLLVLIGEGLLGLLASTQAQTAPAMTALPPQQMPINGVPATYPSTYPTTPSPYPVTSYPPVAVPSAGPPALPRYDTALPGGAALATPMDAPGAFHAPYGLPNDQGAFPTHSSSVPSPAYAPYGSPDPATAAQSLDSGAYVERSLASDDDDWAWQLLPNGLMYKSYLAGNREPRFGAQFVRQRNGDCAWDSTLGARFGLVRYGANNEFWPQGWQLDLEGAAFPRLTLDSERNLIACDFRAGMPLTMRQGPWEMKFGYYHYSSHIGDEYLIANPGFDRLNYVRETLILGLAFNVNPSLRLYGETGWAFVAEGQAKPWEFQFGADFCSNKPTGHRGAPFFAINCHLHEEVDFSGNLTVQTGWMWRGTSGHLFRIGMQYFNGMSDQGQFFRNFEEQIGGGIWYDF
jgi:hypothetical protein